MSQEYYTTKRRRFNHILEKQCIQIELLLNFGKTKPKYLESSAYQDQPSIYIGTVIIFPLENNFKILVFRYFNKMISQIAFSMKGFSV